MSVNTQLANLAESVTATGTPAAFAAKCTFKG